MELSPTQSWRLVVVYISSSGSHFYFFSKKAQYPYLCGGGGGGSGMNFTLLQAKKIHRTQGHFAYYSQQIYNYSNKIHPLSATTIFPGIKEAEEAFYALKDNVENSVVWMTI